MHVISVASAAFSSFSPRTQNESARVGGWRGAARAGAAERRRGRGAGGQRANSPHPTTLPPLLGTAACLEPRVLVRRLTLATSSGSSSSPHIAQSTRPRRPPASDSQLLQQLARRLRDDGGRRGRARRGAGGAGAGERAPGRRRAAAGKREGRGAPLKSSENSNDVLVPRPEVGLQLCLPRRGR